MNRGARLLLIVLGVAAVVVGAVFAGQGLNLIPGSFMTGSRMWLTIGLIVFVVGAILLALGFRRPATRRR